MYNFLTDDLNKLEIAINEGDKEEVERFFSYWTGSSGHIKSLKMANGGSINMNKHIWEGWTVGGFIEDLEPTFNQIMTGSSWQEPFKTKEEVKKWTMDNQPNYKKNIPEVVNYFWARVQSKENYANGGSVGSGKNGYVAFYKGKQVDVYADTKYEAQKLASQHFKAKKDYDVNVVLVELDGKPYVNKASFADGGETNEYTLNYKIEFTTSGEDSYLEGNVGGDIMDLSDVKNIDTNKYSAIAKSSSVAFEGLKGQELEDEIYNQMNEMFATNDSIEVDLESVEFKYPKWKMES
jgi:hypothetical protein